MDITPQAAVLWSGLMTGVITPTTAYFLTEMRLRRQRRWDQEDRSRIAAETRAQINAVHVDVNLAKDKADAAYHEANGVNVWRAQFTKDIHERQADVLSATRDIQDVATDIAEKVTEQLNRPIQPPLIILPAPPLQGRE